MFYHLKFSWRNLRRDGVFSLINIAGLSVGLTVVLLICAMIFNEYSFDQSFSNKDRIYRANSYMKKMMAGQTCGITSNAFAPAVREEIPEVETAVRTVVRPAMVKVGETPYKVDKLCWAEEDFFRLFDTPFIYGSPETVFSRPNTVAIAESEAKILFGDKNPVGETIWVDNQNQMEVSAVYKDFPDNSSFGDYQMIGHFMSSPLAENPYWGNFSVETFCLLTPGADVPDVEARMQQVVLKGVGDDVFQIKLQRLDRIHLYSKGYVYSFTSNPGDIGRVKMLSLLAVIILLVASINYMNLSTARAQKRSKEIGVSKTLGAKRKNIILRLYAETGILTFLAFVLAFVLIWLLLPVFNGMLGQDVRPDVIFNTMFLLGILSVYAITTFFAASYPAFYLSGFAPLTVIRQAGFVKGGSHALVRKGLTVIQFSVAVILIAWVIVIRTQVNYVSNKNIGYNVHQILGIPINTVSHNSGFDALKNDYLAQGSVLSAAFSQAFPVHFGDEYVLFKTLADSDEAKKTYKLPANTVLLATNRATPEIIDLLHLRLIAGTTLPERRPDDTIIHIVVNRKTIEFLETIPEEIIGKKLPCNFYNGPSAYVSGVVEDFNFKNLHEPIGPHGFHDYPKSGLGYLLLKMKNGDMSQQLRAYDDIFKKYFPNELFRPQFPSLLLEKAYESDRQTNRIALSFSILAILVACMGVFGLTAFMAEQRTKEIGIRKVLGASISSIVSLFTDNYLRLLLFSLVVAVPIAWWIGNKYLESFAYRISLSWWMFAVAALITVALTLLTVGALAIKAATANPVKAIKSE